MDDFFGHGAENRGGDEARTHGIGADTLAAEFPCPGLGHADDTKFGSGIVCLAKVTVKADDRRGIQNDTRLLLKHLVQNGFGTVVDTLQIDVDDVVELLFGHVLQLGISDNTRVVDEAINALPFVDRGLDHGVQRLDIADIGDLANGFTACCLAHLDRLIDPFLLDVGNHDFRAFTDEFECRRLTDTPSGASDNGYLAFESHASPLVMAHRTTHPRLIYKSLFLLYILLAAREAKCNPSAAHTRMARNVNQLFTGRYLPGFPLECGQIN